MMDRSKITREAKCLILLAGRVLEQRIEKRALEISESRASTMIESQDIEMVFEQFLEQDLSDLPHRISQAMDRYKQQVQELAKVA